MNNNAHRKNEHTSQLTGVCSTGQNPVRDVSRLPVRGGVCLKPQHYKEILQILPDVGWFEVHAENYLGAGGPALHYLEKIRQHYALSIHGVGLSIGSADGLDANHLRRVAALVDRFEPESFSEHLAWSTHDGEFHSDLLPVPCNEAVENIVCEHIDTVQNTLKRQLLLENPSNYLTLESSTMDEAVFLQNVVRRTGCGLLLDVNNVYVSSVNCGYSACDYISALGLENVGEIHLAGHSTDDTDPTEVLLIDAHDRPVCDQVWSLFEYTLALGGNRPALIEWDNSVPPLQTLLNEMHKADRAIGKTGEVTRVISV